MKTMRGGARGIVPISIPTFILITFIPWTAGLVSAAQPAQVLAYKGIALGMTKRDVCSQVMGMAFANEVACRTWQGDTLSPSHPDPDFDRLGRVPVITIIHFTRSDDADARVDEIVLNFSHADYPVMRATLIQEHGLPTKRELGQVQDDTGKTLASEALTWEDPNGLIRLLERFEGIDRSGVLFIPAEGLRRTPGVARTKKKPEHH